MTLFGGSRKGLSGPEAHAGAPVARSRTRSNRYMGIIGGEVGYRILRRIAPAGKGTVKMDGSAYAGKSKIRALLGDALLERLKGKRVLDFGCGEGGDSLEIARSGAQVVIGLDIQERLLEVARERATAQGLDDRVRFVTDCDEPVDTIVSIDSFEHFADPEAVLAAMHRLLQPGGEVICSFGPTWYHPLGGHLFSVFPWAHLVFTEAALIRWRSDFKTDGATRFGEVAGGLNQMTIARFRRMVRESPFELLECEEVPIRRLAPLHGRWTREFFTAIVRARLVAH